MRNIEEAFEMADQLDVRSSGVVICPKLEFS